jgi:hypothetical protein
MNSHSILPFPECRQVNFEPFRDLLGSWGTSELCLQCGCDRLDLPALHSHRPGSGIAASEIVQNSSANPEHGVGAERETTGEIEAIERLHQAQGTGTDQFPELDRRDSARDFTRHVMHETQVSCEQLVSGLRVARGAVPCPQDIDPGLGLGDGDCGHTPLQESFAEGCI